jgi:hypothetical protein
LHALSSKPRTKSSSTDLNTSKASPIKHYRLYQQTTVDILLHVRIHRIVKQ